MAGGVLTQGTGVAPSAPSTSYVSTYPDSADNDRLKTITSGGVVSIASQVLKPNALANGGFTFAQRQAPATLTTYSNTTGRSYAADRWGITNENASVQYRRIDTIAAPETGLTARYYARYMKITAAGKMVFSQVLEGTDSAPMRGRTVRFSVRMRYGTNAMTMRLGLAYLTSAGTVDTMPATFVSAFGAVGTDPTLGTNLTYLTPVLTESTGTISGSGVTCVLTNAWQRFSATFSVPSSALNVVAILWTNGQPAANDDVFISEAMLTDGANIVDWSPEDVGAELARVSRFYSKTFPIDAAPVQNLGVNSGEFLFVATVAGANTNRSATYQHPVRMRVAPTTITLYSPAAASTEAYDETAAAACTATQCVWATDLHALITCTANAGTAIGNLLGVHLTFNAEL